jgi:hypothetical protein
MDFASNLCSVCAPFSDVRRHRVKKAFVLYRQNVMLETQCCLFAIHSRFPKLNVAGSIPVSRSRFLVGTLLCSVPDAKNLYGALGHTVNGDVG